MTTTDPTAIADTSLAALVTARPAAARVFERFGLDYCCGGSATLASACAAAGVDPAIVDAELAALGAASPADWAAMSPADLVDHLEATHHAYLHTELDRLQRLVEKVEAVHGANHPELAEVRSTYVRLRADLEPHLMKEERVLFPMIRELASATAAPEFHCGTLRNPISVMLAEHDRAGELLAHLRSATGGYEAPADACGSYRALYDGLAELEADTHLHVHKENNVLFPAVVAAEAALSS